MQRNAVYLEDDSGTAIFPVHFEQTAESTDAFAFAFHFKPTKSMAAYQLVYTVPTAFTMRRIPFRLQGLKLP